ncbi:MAG: hypothetical protein H6Q74_1359 [Firmicutes bacterium]|nr:hypothetical protein [Bacillota bacterium]
MTKTKIYKEAFELSQKTEGVIYLYLLNGKYKYTKEAEFPAEVVKYQSQGKKVEIYRTLYKGKEI